MRQIIVGEYDYGTEVTLVNTDHVLTESVPIPGVALGLRDDALDAIKGAIATLLYWEERKVKEAGGG